MAQRKTFRFRTNSKLEKLIGRELITNNIIAFFELIKNSYDAGAQCSEIKFINVKNYIIDNTKKNKEYFIDGRKVNMDEVLTNNDSYIIIEDNGQGMSFDDVEKYWMEIGVVHKELIKQIQFKDDSVNKMYNRILNGEKGIGRFSTDKLGSQLEMTAVDKTGAELTTVFFDWDKYNDHSLLLQEVEHDYIHESLTTSKKSGVKLKILKLRDSWSIKDIEELKRQLKKFVSPFSQEQNSFSILFSLNDNTEKIINDAFEYSLTSIEASIYSDGLFKYNISDNNYSSQEYNNLAPPAFGPITVKIIYMDAASKRSFTKRTGLSTREYGNIKVFRDNFRIFPYGEPENDWLNIDNKHAQAVFRSLGTRDIIGYVQISNLENEGLKDATDRIGLVEDTKEFEEFKKFIWRCIELLQNHVFNKIKKEAEQQGNIIFNTIEDRREKEATFKTEVIKALKNTQMAKTDADKIIGLIENNNKELQKDLNEMKKANIVLNKKIKVFQRITGTEGMLIDLLHTIKNKTALLDSKLNKIIIQNPEIKKESHNMKSILTTINKMLDSALRKASSSRLVKKKEILSDIILESIEENSSICSENNITISHEFKDNHRRVMVNRESIKIVFDNLFSNSVKALKMAADKKIHISTKYDQGIIEIFFQDTGIGINQDDAPFIFNVTFTETRGNGLGLSTSLDIIQSHDGDISYITFPEENEVGACFLIKLPIEG